MAVASFELGTALDNGVATLSLVPEMDVPASDPTAGATLVFIWIMTADEATVGVASITDDATTPGDYGTCFFEDGLNHYAGAVGPTFSNGAGVGGIFTQSEAWWGIIMNPLTIASTITITLNGTEGFVLAYARFYTGINVPAVGPQSTDIASWLFTSVQPIGGTALADGSNEDFNGVEWSYLSGTTPHLTLPTGSSGPTDWQWVDGGPIAVYGVGDIAETVASGGWTWANGAIVTQAEFDDVPAVGDVVVDMVYAEQSGITTPDIGEDLTGAWGSIANTFTFGSGFILNPGPGPSCGTPPATGNPVFNNHIRLSD